MTSAKKILSPWLLVLLLVGSVGLALLRAQEKSAASQRQASNEPQNPGGPGRRLAHESLEAAGEEKDETAEFKQSASVRLIARLTGLKNLQQAYWLSVVLNFAVIVWLIVWAGNKYLPKVFRDRTAAIQKAMLEAQKAGEEARGKLTEIASRLDKLDSEIAIIRDAAEKEAAAEASRIRAAAEEDARKIVASAEQEIAAAAKAARRQLTAHAADLAVGLAQRQIRVDAATDQALVRSFAAELGAVTDNGSDAGRKGGS
ncbi:MAG TPA: ATPase [Verrucomicrobiae bacterium]|nr:ATPase [Verrucomicrobiae bacterium]